MFHDSCSIHTSTQLGRLLFKSLSADRSCSNSTLKILLLLTLFFLLTFTIKKGKLKEKKKNHDIHFNFLNFSRVKRGDMRERKTRCKVTEDTFKRICQVLKGNKKKKGRRWMKEMERKDKDSCKRWL